MPSEDRFFSQINYASFHEDSNSERRGLRLKTTDRVLCLTGSGARVLDLLLDDPSEIVALDWNPTQSYLLELKLAVIKRLNYDDGMAFLGFREMTNRVAIYSELRRDLSGGAQEFWGINQDVIRQGVFFHGRWESFLRRVSWLARWVRRGLVRQLMEAEDLDQQYAFWRQKWDSFGWRIFLAIATNRWLVRYVLREPGLNFVPPGLSISRVICNRFDQASRRVLFRESPWVWALFKGQVEIDGPLPEHLHRNNFEALRERIENVVIRTGSLHDYLKSSDNAFDAFSLSDFCSYCDQPTYDAIWHKLLSRSAKGARFCERRFLVEYPLAGEIEACLAIDQELATELANTDSSIVYNFLIAELQ